MFYNLKIAIRNLRKSGLYSVINIAGLAISLTIVILIMLWVQDELSYDKFHSGAKEIYRLNAEVSEGNIWTNTPAPIALFAKNEITEIEQACRIGGYYKNYFDYNNQKYRDLNGIAVDNAFFSMFNFPLLKGEKGKPFTDDLSIILSETKAKAIFGEEDPIGKTLTANDNTVFHITGIIKDSPKNSTLKYDYIVPFETLQRTFTGNGDWKYINDDWGSYRFRTYFSIRPGTDSQALSVKIGEMVDRLRGDKGQSYIFRLQPLLKIHLYAPNGEPLGMKYVWLFGIIAVLILVIACINYVNLVTGRAIRRNREMGIRKVIGAKKANLLMQLLNETVFLFLIAIIIATILVYLLLQPYNHLAGKEMSYNLFSLPVLLIYGISAISVIALAGLYPAFFISSFKPLDAFQNKPGRNKHGYFRRILVVLQFICSFMLIVATITISKQLDYMRHKDLGYNKEHVFTVWSVNMGSHYDTVKNELMKNKDILGVATAESGNMGISGARTDITWPGKEEGRNVEFCYLYASYDFFELMGVHLVSGEYFSAMDSSSILVNEEAVRQMGVKNAIGTPILNLDGMQIKGVVKDYNFDRLNEPIKPLLIIPTYGANSCIYIKTTSSGAQSAIASVEKLWKQYNPEYEFSYNFLDENFDNQYKSDIRSGKLFTIFAFLAIFISCLGLFGLVTYTAETKTKEIGIRKVLGATVSNIVNMLSNEFLILVGVAMLVAFPLSWYWLNNMLQEYAYRISIGWWIFALAGIVTISLTLLTVGWQAIKAATANPVKSIKTE